MEELQMVSINRRRLTAAVTATLVAGTSLGFAATAGAAGVKMGSVHADSNYWFGAAPSQQGKPTTGGTVSIAEPVGAGPTYIFPITPSAQQSVYNDYDFQYFMWRPIWWGPQGTSPTYDYSQSLAGPPKFTNDNKTVTITIDPGWKWSDGNPVTSTDLDFFYWILKAAVKESAANYGNYTPGLFPDNVASVSTPSASTFVINFTKTYNTSFDLLAQLDVLMALPAHTWSKASANGPIEPFDNIKSAEAIYNFLNAQAKDTKTYGSNPIWQVVDGPYKIQSFDPATGANTMVANTGYSGPVKPHISQIDEVSFTSPSSEFDQLLTGKLDVGYVNLNYIPQVSNLRSKGYDVFGYPDYGFYYIDYNFKDTTGSFNNVIKQLYVRQALAHLQDEAAEIKSRGIYNGAAGFGYGPVPAAPSNQFTPASATNNPYPFSISTASKLLSSHGWKVNPGSVTTCVKPGTASNECGAGIAAGTAMSWTLFYANNTPTTAALDEAWASNLSQVGIQLKLVSKTFNFILQNYDDPAAPKNDNAWNMIDFGGFTISYYPTTNEIFNTTGSFNIGGFSDPAVDKAILDSEFSTSNSALTHELSLVTELQPALFQPTEDRIYAFKSSLSGTAASLASSTQEQYSPEYWYFTK